jgi:hypothetical protein
MGTPMLRRRQHRDQPERLEDEADGVSAQGQQPVLVECSHLVPVHLDSSGLGLVQSADEIEQGGLAGPRSTADRQHLPSGNGEGRVLERVYLDRPGPVDHVHMVDDHHGV